ncbi:efflux RND transporter permease subunit [Sulfurospirillum diekertiae]|uniref:Efflux pump membrane transporter BepE n=1 Tax=Sulfurospirillum diekertiae TaxID=1854492 RepID=A0A1Y0HK30_9BACT|nr:multidrug efflux RND transporter permease subunit [Sulfurospirillum diekertiae]ARU47926.1 Efflux pump membrane transporter BepE [Sulfurospirillum diekertiae]ASC92772.1 Efflux pump membrane transporter BepE [Sulfurospirillum diekertiae]
MFSKFFINRPIFATVVSIVIILAGIIAIKSLPVQEYPSIAPPQIIVSATYPGADAQTLATTVAAPLEEEINGVPNMLYMTTTASPSGSVSISVYFQIGTDVAQAKVDVNNRVQIATNKLPEAVRRQGVSTRERSPDILKVLALTSKGNVHDTTFISNYALVNIVDDLKRIPGVGDVSIFGNKNYSIRAWINPDKLATYELTTAEVVNAIKSQNEQYAAGQIGQEPMEKEPTFTYTVKTDGRLKNATEFENIILKSNADGSSLKLKDVARVELGVEAYYFGGIYNNNPMIPIGIFLASGANALEVSDLLDKKLAEISTNFPADLQINTAYDPTTFVRESIHEVIFTLLLSIALVVGIIYLFLGNLRATFIPVLAIPVSIVGTFAGFYAAGFSINLLTLFGLTLAIGLVVDDAIVVIENVERILRDEEDLSVKDATIKAMREITNPVIAIVMVLCAVFIPAAFMGGFSGMMYKQFAMTVIISVTISGIVALTLTPALCALLLRKHESEPFWLIQKFNALFEVGTKLFSTGVRKTIRFGIMNVAVFGVMIFAIYLITTRIPTGLVPNEDKGIILVINNLMPGASLGRTQKVSQEVSNFAFTDPNVERVGAMSGIDFITGAYKTDAGISFVRLKDWDQRPRADQTSQAIAGKMMMGLFQNKEAMLIPVTPPPIMGMSTTGGFEMYIQDRTGSDIQVLDGYVKTIIEKASARKELAAMRTTLNTNVPQFLINVDNEKAKSLGVDVADIFTTIQATFGNTYTNDFNLFGRTYHVNVQSESTFREGTENYNDIFVKSSEGRLVPISSLASIKRIVGPSVVQKFNMFQAAQISGQPAPGYSSGDALRIIEEVAKEVLPNGYTIAWAGTSYQEKQLEKSGNTAFIYAIIFVFLILAALYESWTIPFAIVLAVPFALFGAALAVYFRDLQNDIYFQVGLVTLVGLSSKNAILMVEFAIQKMHEGYNLLDATIEGARIRFRPIVMTSFAFIAGTLPLALSTGAGANSRHIIGTTVVGGMITLTLIGTFFVPLFFYLIMKTKEKIDSKRSRS